MWSQLPRWVRANFPLFLLLAVLGVVTWSNYPWTTSLLGWDSVQPELDFGINLRRALTSVWVGNQGVGHIGGHGYATILIQGLIEWAMNLAVGVAQTRGVFIFSMLWLGPIGVYFLWKKWFGNTGKFANWGAMLSALFYLLNLGTVQVFYAPLEAFTVFYGLLPWAILSIVNYLSDPSRKRLFVLLIAQIIFSMIGFIPPQFIAYGMVVFALLVGYVIERRRDLLRAFRNVFIVGTILLAANMYWLAPITYYSIYGAKSYIEAKNNQISTPDFQYMSESRGRWSDVALMRGFFIDSSDSVIKGEGKFFEIFEPWNNYLHGDVEWVGYSLFAMAMLGLLMILAKKGKKSLGLSMILVLGIGWVAIAQAEEPFNTIANLVHNVPVVGQAFRAAFTKFVGLLIFVYAIGFGYGIFTIYKLLREKLMVSMMLVMIGVGSLIFYMWPMFRGNLIYERMKVNMPSEYGQVMKFFRNQDKQDRIAYLPSAWMWGWQVHEWGYSGSGFLWYGIEQPILDRAFDVWSPYNETFYNEFSTALYASEPRGVEGVLDKYDVRYVLLDESVVAPGQDRGILRIEETKRLAEDLGWVEKFREGFLTVWDLGERGNQFVSAPMSYTLLEGDTGKVRRDVVYEDVGTYVSGGGEVNYPFANLMREEVRGIEYGEGKIILNRNLEETPPAFGVPTLPSAMSPVEESPQITIPGWKVGEIVRIEYKDKEPIPAYYVNDQSGPIFLGKEKPEEGMNIIYARISEGEEWREYLQEFRLQIPDSSIKIEVPSEPQIYDFGEDGQGTSGNCDVLKRGVAQKQGISYVADGRGAVCDYVVMSQLDTRLSYLMRVQGENKDGRSVKFFLYNTGSKRNDIEYLLGKDKFDQTFSLLPWAWDGYYTLNIETRSFGQRTENLIDPVEVRWFPVEQIAGARLPTRSDLAGSEGGIEPTRSDLRIAEIHKTGTWLYRVRVEGSGLLKLSQGYDEGWVGVQITNHKFSNSQILKQVKVDGWANGWMVNGNGEVTIFYWPQLLEYIGFALLGLTTILLSK